VIALVEPNGRVHVGEGKVEGKIALEPRGANGWGYDPVFLLPELGKTMAELNTWRRISMNRKRHSWGSPRGDHKAVVSALSKLLASSAHSDEAEHSRLGY
jgi:hypothetical protein